jgi:hypothetical protein
MKMRAQSIDNSLSSIRSNSSKKQNQQVFSDLVILQRSLKNQLGRNHNSVKNQLDYDS